MELEPRLDEGRLVIDAKVCQQGKAFRFDTNHYNEIYTVFTPHPTEQGWLLLGFLFRRSPQLQDRGIPEWSDTRH